MIPYGVSENPEDVRNGTQYKYFYPKWEVDYPEGYEHGTSGVLPYDIEALIKSFEQSEISQYG